MRPTTNGSLTGARRQLEALCGDPPPWPELPAAYSSDTAERPAAVLMLFGVLDSAPATAPDAALSRELDVLLVRRADTLTDHPGQISFPGGRLDADDDGPVGAALREAHEETGLDPAGVEVLGTLPPIPLPVTNYVVTPVLGWWSRPSPVRAVDPGESAEVFRAPVADLVDPERRRTERLEWRGDEVTTPGFLVNGHLVWGFTAHVLDRLLDALDWSVPWDPTRSVRNRR